MAIAGVASSTALQTAVEALVQAQAHSDAGAEADAPGVGSPTERVPTGPATALQAVPGAAASALAGSLSGELSGALANGRTPHAAGHAAADGAPGERQQAPPGPARERAESATRQTAAGVRAAASEAPPASAAVSGSPANALSPAGATPAAAPAGSTPFAVLPLVTATLTSLHVEPAWAWSLQGRGFAASTAASAASRRSGDQAAPEDDDDAHDDARDSDEATADGAGPHGPPPHRSPDAAAEPWAEPLAQALREALATASPHPALRAAAEQWRLGRCVVLACPQGADPAGAAWAFVLWPRPQARTAERLALFGLRVDAQLSWARLPPGIEWCHTRLIKTHHPRRGRQLAAVDADAADGVPCELQLGPVRPAAQRWREGCVRVDSVRRFWAALSDQWSVTVVLRSRPFASLRPATGAAAASGNAAAPPPAARESAC